MMIRPLVAADRAGWAPLWQGYLEFYKARVPSEVTELTFARLTGGQEPMGGFVAADDAGALIGIVHWITHRSCWTAGDYCYLQDLFVARDRRGGGIGRKLIEAVYDGARLRGCSRVYWLTHETNTDAMLLYDRIGDRSGFVQYRKIFER
jgi:GNAT superfamily N-acetyltransferase